jgi:hypothetical protein
MGMPKRNCNPGQVASRPAGLSPKIRGNRDRKMGRSDQSERRQATAAQALVKFMSSPRGRSPHPQERHGATAALTGSFRATLAAFGENTVPKGYGIHVSRRT